MIAQTENSVEPGGHGLMLKDDRVILSDERMDIALDAVIQIAALSRHLARIADIDIEAAEFPHVVRGIGLRIHRLSSAVVGAINDEMETVEKLAEEVKQ